MFNPFSNASTRSILFFCFLLFTGFNLMAQQNSSSSPRTVTPVTKTVADLGAPVLACSTVIPEGGMVIAEYFLTEYEFAYRRVAMFKAHNFEHAALMHTDCQSVDVKGDFYFSVVSPVMYDEASLYEMMEELERKAKKEGLKFGLLRIVRNQD